MAASVPSRPGSCALFCAASCFWRSSTAFINLRFSGVTAEDFESAVRGRIGNGIGGLGIGRANGGLMKGKDDVLAGADAGTAWCLELSRGWISFFTGLTGGALRRGILTVAGREDTGRELWVPKAGSGDSSDGRGPIFSLILYPFAS